MPRKICFSSNVVVELYPSDDDFESQTVVLSSSAFEDKEPVRPSRKRVVARKVRASKQAKRREKKCDETPSDRAATGTNDVPDSGWVPLSAVTAADVDANIKAIEASIKALENEDEEIMQFIRELRELPIKPMHEDEILLEDDAGLWSPVDTIIENEAIALSYCTPSQNQENTQARFSPADGCDSPASTQTSEQCDIIDLRVMLEDTPRWIVTGNGDSVSGYWGRPSEVSSVESTGRSVRAVTRSLRRDIAFDTGRLIEVEWPRNVIRLSHNFNPLGIKFQDVPAHACCDCPRPCRVGSCANAHNYVYCRPNSCPYEGKCGNGLETHPSISLMRYGRKGEYTLICTADIEKGVAIGQYLGELKAARSSAPPQTRNNGFRLLLHRDLDHGNTERFCIDARNMGTLMRFLNHACDPATRFRQVCNGEHHTVVVVSNRYIRAGEELTVGYGDDLWFMCCCLKCKERKECAK
jgi:hypothetical protein